MREEIELSSLAKMFLREQIKSECWDSMTIKGKVIKVSELVYTYIVFIYMCAYIHFIYTCTYTYTMYMYVYRVFMALLRSVTIP